MSKVSVQRISWFLTELVLIGWSLKVLVKINQLLKMILRKIDH